MHRSPPPAPDDDGRQDLAPTPEARRRMLALAEELRDRPSDPRLELIRLLNRTLAPLPPGRDRLAKAGR